MQQAARVPSIRRPARRPAMAIALAALLGIVSGAATDAGAAFTFPVDCAALPQDCAGSNVP